MRGRDAAFVVRIWVEEREIEGAPPLWRGVVEHPESGARCYVTDLEEISGFIKPYLLGLLERSDATPSEPPAGSRTGRLLPLSRRTGPRRGGDL